MSDKSFVSRSWDGFGAEFIPIHQAHPNAELVAVCRRNEEEMNKAPTSSTSPSATPITTSC